MVNPVRSTRREKDFATLSDVVRLVNVGLAEYEKRNDLLSDCMAFEDMMNKSLQIIDDRLARLETPWYKRLWRKR